MDPYKYSLDAGEEKAAPILINSQINYMNPSWAPM